MHLNQEMFFCRRCDLWKKESYFLVLLFGFLWNEWNLFISNSYIKYVIKGDEIEKDINCNFDNVN